jgi:predicted nucleic acid-binding protein
VDLRRLYLIDKSAWEQRRYEPMARERVTELREGARLAICIVTMAELLYSARNAGEMDRDHAYLSELRLLPVTPAAEQHVISIMKQLAATGQHRRPISDIMLAAIAQAHGAIVLHYDHDFEIIAEATGQPHEWIVPRGTGHSSTSNTKE